ncbi:hypothetical protein KJ708_02095 [bacterium]|nr:hypothetical protein [bacterium]MBU1918501.1 hypothetical protein [bacterium]
MFLAILLISGVVVDEKGNPLDHVIVKWQNADIETITNDKGQFTLPITKELIAKHKIITAAKQGYYIGGVDVSKDHKAEKIVLKKISSKDHSDYVFKENKFCEKCHPAIMKEFQQDAHAQSATNPLFLKFFKGVSKLGYKKDFPTANGNCSACHAPVMAVNQAYNQDPHKAQGAARDGVACDYCHKIKEAKVDRTGGYPGVLAYTLTRPGKDHQVFYGPLKDVFPSEDSYNPLYKESRYCAPCHNGTFWNTLVYSEYKEWEESAYAKKNITCQACHMSLKPAYERFALEKEGGLKRDPKTIASHKNLGIKDELFMKEAIKLEGTSWIEDGKLHVKAIVTNTGAGHHYPTGNPMRNMLLLVAVKNTQGKEIILIKGNKLPSWAGEEAGLPGKGFAKILVNATPYPSKKRRSDFTRIYPSPHWRPAYIQEDTRIVANASDETKYIFDLGNTNTKDVHVSLKLIYRRTFKNWQKMMGIDLPDLVLAEEVLLEIND